jgi:hypothetical protein
MNFGRARTIHVGRNKVAQGLAASSADATVIFLRPIAGLNRKKRPKFRRRGRLLVPAYKWVNNPG